MNFKETLEKYGIKPSRYLDQHFIKDTKIIDRLVDYAEINESDTVLEIGPGIGRITERLVEKAGKVIGIERDERFCEILLQKGFPNFELIEGDVLRARLPDFDKIVSNLPFGISSPLTFELFNHKWEVGVLIYQKEFAERMIAKPGDPNYSRLSIGVRYFCTVEILEKIPKEKFYPQPEIDGSIVKLTQKIIKKDKEEFFWNLIRAAFRNKNKKLKNALADSSFLLGLKEDEIRSLDIPLLEKKVFLCSTEDFEKIDEILREKYF